VVSGDRQQQFTDQFPVLRRTLHRWYQSNARTFPWRETNDPYLIWVSEIMLQQTQAARVVPYFTRFVAALPTVHALAKASDAKLLRLWRGLGYYRRAQNLRLAAQEIVRTHDGVLPRTFAELCALPGIGEYTANAILSFAFKKQAIASDTNLQRIFGRLCPAAPDAFAVSLFGKSRRSSALNQSLMDLGNLVCRSDPKCGECPLTNLCPSAGRVAVRTRSRSRIVKAAVEVGVACIHRNGRYLIAKRPAWKGGAWEFPGGKREGGEDLRNCLKREIAEELGIEIAVRPPFLQELHQISGETYRLSFCRCQILRGKPDPLEHQAIAWVEPEKLSEFDFAPTNQSALLRLRKFPVRKSR